MKYCILIIDGAAGWPLPEMEGKTCLELAYTPNLDALAKEATVGLLRTVPPGMEPSSAHACTSLLGYDPAIYHPGRAAIEARSMGIPINEGEVLFRCNLVSADGGVMQDYSAGHISTGEAKELLASLEKHLGTKEISFHPGISYRHICKIRGGEDTLQAVCTPPHDIPDRGIKDYLPKGPGSELLRDLMERSAEVLRDHPVNLARKGRGELPATMIWLFWGSGYAPDMPAFGQVYGLSAAITAGVDVLRGLAQMIGMDVLDVPGVTDGLDNDFAAQAEGALKALEDHDLVVIHVEAADEAGHGGLIDEKVSAIEIVDKEVVSRLGSWQEDSLRVLVAPDHPTPIAVQTHVPDPVPFLLWGPGFTPNGARRFTEAEAERADLRIDPGYNIIRMLVRAQ
jgi:2,3-bisphosphoglycerate-independent phosphoglycerate mutase